MIRSVAPYFDEAARILRVPLPKAVRARIRLSMMLTKKALPLLGVFDLLTDADKSAQRDRALNGQHWMFTPWTVIEVVHATQRPLLAPESRRCRSSTANSGQTSARPLIHARCSVDSTDRLDLFAEWHEPIDVGVADSQTGPADRQRRDAAFQVKVTGPKQYADATTGARAGGFPEHDIDWQRPDPHQPPIATSGCRLRPMNSTTPAIAGSNTGSTRRRGSASSCRIMC